MLVEHYCCSLVLRMFAPPVNWSLMSIVFTLKMDNLTVTHSASQTGRPAFSQTQKEEQMKRQFNFNCVSAVQSIPSFLWTWTWSFFSLFKIVVVNWEEAEREGRLQINWLWVTRSLCVCKASAWPGQRFWRNEIIGSPHRTTPRPGQLPCVLYPNYSSLSSYTSIAMIYIDCTVWLTDWVSALGFGLFESENK